MDMPHSHLDGGYATLAANPAMGGVNRTRNMAIVSGPAPASAPLISRVDLSCSERSLSLGGSAGLMEEGK